MTASLERNNGELIGRVPDMAEYLRLRFISDNSAAVGDAALRHYEQAVKYIENVAERPDYTVAGTSLVVSPAHPAVEDRLRDFASPADEVIEG